MANKDQRKGVRGAPKRPKHTAKGANGTDAGAKSRLEAHQGDGSDSEDEGDDVADAVDEDVMEVDDAPVAGPSTPARPKRNGGPIPARLAELQQSANSLTISGTPHSSTSSSTGALGVGINGREVGVHRCRFVDYQPGSVTALAVTPDSWDAARWAEGVSLHSEGGKGDTEGGGNREVVAVGRGNGDIEIWVWAGRQHWIQVRRLPGHIPSPSASEPAPAPKIEHVVFVHQTQLSPDAAELCDSDEEVKKEEMELRETRPRLIGSTGGQEVVEWEWQGGEAGKVKRASLLSASTTIWSMSVSPRSSMLAVGCDDGSIRLLSLLDDDLSVLRSLEPCKTRILSVAWGPPPSQQPGKKPASNKNRDGSLVGVEDEADWVVAGCADSSLRKYDTKSGRCLARMTVDKLKGEQTLVWAVAVASNTIVSGDSLGNLKFFDPVHFNQLQSIRAHRADILCLCVSSNGKTIFSAGVDQKTCQVTRVDSGEDGSGGRWVGGGSKRLHSHDVRALVVSPPFAYPSPHSRSGTKISRSAESQIPVLLSGGLDTSLVLCPALAPSAKGSTSAFKNSKNPITESPSALFSDTMHRRISHVPQRQASPIVAMSKATRTLVARREQGVSMWHVGGKQDALEIVNGLLEDPDRNRDEQENGWQKVLDMELKCRTNLVSHAISPDGRWLAVSDLLEVKLFRLSPSPLDPAPRRVRSFAPFAGLSVTDQGASHLVFTADSSRLLLATSRSAQIVVLALGDEDGTAFEVLKVFDQHRRSGSGSTSRSRAMAGRSGLRPKTNGVNGHPPKTPNGASETDSEDENAFSSSDESEEDEGGPAGTAIAVVGISGDGQWLASADFARRLHVFNLDTLQHHCALPTPELIASALTFMPSSTSTLIVGMPNNSLYIFDVEERQLAPWARQLSSHPPRMLKSLRDPLIGLVIDPAYGRSTTPRSSVYGGSANGSPVSWDRDDRRDESLIMWGATWICRMGLQRPVTTANQKTPKRRRNGNSKLPAETPRTTATRPLVDGSSSSSSISSPGARPPTQFRLSHKYQPLLLLDFIGPSEMVIVERPFFSLLDALPPAWERTGQYGT